MRPGHLEEVIRIVAYRRQVIQMAVLQAVVLQEDDSGAVRVSRAHPVAEVPVVRLSPWANMLQQPRSGSHIATHKTLFFTTYGTQPPTSKPLFYVFKNPDTRQTGIPDVFCM